MSERGFSSRGVRLAGRISSGARLRTDQLRCTSPDGEGQGSFVLRHICFVFVFVLEFGTVGREGSSQWWKQGATVEESRGEKEAVAVDGEKEAVAVGGEKEAVAVGGRSKAAAADERHR
ncbi:hypothetical protein L2E82_28458 [Cichorium intybus]|uniref:Uncharacterized protein n=1 Tax=Cichorium intybus TaxID=13427 RepID=A0ACB9CW25_CICIN|nr:hypothetical protein L2E82_28458 [Cichorium intybus]